MRLLVWLAPLLSGALFAFAQPGYDVFPLAYFFLLPLLWAFSQPKSRPLLWFGMFELIKNVLLLAFIPKVMVHFGGMHPVLGLTGWLSLALFLALLCAPFGLLISRVLSTAYGWALIPLFFAAKDAMLEHIFSGFPWCLLGYSQLKVSWLMQWAELGGVHLVTALVIMLNLLLFRLISKERKQTFWALCAVLAVILSTGVLLRRHSQQLVEGSGQVVRLAVVQPNSSYDNFNGFEPRLTELLSLSSGLVKQGAQAVIWPEYSLPIYPRQWPAYGERFQTFARNNAPLIGGFTDRRSRREFFNSVFLYDGQNVQQYNKIHLAPFGEYIPLRPLFFFISRITNEIADFTPGTGPHPLILMGHKIGLPICYEAIFPMLVCRFVNQGAELLVVTSNDSWYSGGMAHNQLLAMSATRAIENRRFLLRSTANGISAWVTPLGEVRDEIPYGIEGSFIADVRFISSKTLFTLGGVYFGLGCLALCVLMGVGILRKRFSKKIAE